tara:strand:+ start:24 stop:227 length:204 start_codon:yes stop_codon:yes gene_type:complete
MSDWIIAHQKECKILDSDKCNGCFHIEESLWAMSQAQEERKEHKTEEQKQKETKLVYNYKLREWREE